MTKIFTAGGETVLRPQMSSAAIVGWAVQEAGFTFRILMARHKRKVVEFLIYFGIVASYFLIYLADRLSAIVERLRNAGVSPWGFFLALFLLAGLALGAHCLKIGLRFACADVLQPQPIAPEARARAAIAISAAVAGMALVPLAGAALLVGVLSSVGPGVAMFYALVPTAVGVGLYQSGWTFLRADTLGLGLKRSGSDNRPGALQDRMKDLVALVTGPIDAARPAGMGLWWLREAMGPEAGWWRLLRLRNLLLIGVIVFGATGSLMHELPGAWLAMTLYAGADRIERWLHFKDLYAELIMVQPLGFFSAFWAGLRIPVASGLAVFSAIGGLGVLMGQMSLWAFSLGFLGLIAISLFYGAILAVTQGRRLLAGLIFALILALVGQNFDMLRDGVSFLLIAIWALLMWSARRAYFNGQKQTRRR